MPTRLAAPGAHAGASAALANGPYAHLRAREHKFAMGGFTADFRA